MLKLKHSLINAARGIWDLLRTEQNFVIEVIVAIVVLFAAYIFHIRTLEKVAIVIMIVFILTAEGANSVLENILDGFSKNFSPKFRMAKDMLAGVTLIVVLGSLIIGAIIFWPYMRALLFRKI
jgi:diacylglycerol kinase